MKLAYLTHTSIQIFTRKIWEDTVEPSVKKVHIIANNLTCAEISRLRCVDIA